jgi:hypothetical protein
MWNALVKGGLVAREDLKTPTGKRQASGELKSVTKRQRTGSASDGEAGSWIV